MTSIRVLLTLLLLIMAAPLARAAQDSTWVRDVRVGTGDDPNWAAPAFEDGRWPTMQVGEVDTQGQLLWLRARVDVPIGMDMSSTPLGVHMTMAASWELYWNGVLVGHNGTPGATAAAEVPGRIEHEVFIPPNLLLPRDNLLAVRISTQHFGMRLRSPLQAIFVRPYGEIVDGPLRRGALALLAAGPLLLGGAYFFAMFVFDRRDRASLLLSLLAFALLGQLLAEALRSLYSYLYPLHVLRLQVILAFASAGALLLAAYVGGQCAARQMRLWLTALGALIGIVVEFGPGFDGKTLLTLLAGVTFALILALRGALGRVPGAMPIALALAGVLVTLLFDMGRFIDMSWFYAATALLLFLFLRQAALLRAAQRQGSLAELRAAQLELELLKQKIQPHFMMNTLTALSEWVESSPGTGVRMIEALAAEFRTVSAMSGEQLVPLQQELDLCRYHLAVMGFRSNQQFDLKGEGLSLDARVPPAIFHTLIENALTHNRYALGARFSLEERQQGGERVFTLRSPLAEASKITKSSGTGHAYVRARLRHAFGEHWRFSSAAIEGEWVDTVAMPCAY